MDERLTERVVATERIFEGKVVRLERLTVELPGGRAATREVVRHVGAAAVVAVDELGRVAMVRQWRAALDGALTEIPAGKLDGKGEDPLEAARRELREETGLTASHWQRLGEIVTTPGFSDEVIALFFATGLSEGAAQPDEDEFLHVSRVPAGALYAQIERGALRDAKTLCALLMARPLIEKIAGAAAAKPPKDDGIML